MAKSELQAFIKAQILSTQRAPARSAPPAARDLEGVELWNALEAKGA